MNVHGWSITRLRKLRQRVRYTLNLVGDGQRIREKPGTWWRANLETRTVEWVPIWPYPPYEDIDDDGIRYATPHEASHIKWSGRYETKTIKARERKRFHRFVNAIEDVRVDRLSSRQYEGFRPAKLAFDRYARAAQIRNGPEAWSLVDAVALNAVYSFDIGERPVGTELAIEASTRLWPTLSRIANLRSTQEVATALEPIFRSLVTIEEEEKSREEEEREREREREQREREEEEGGQGEPDEDGDPGPGSSDSKDSKDSGGRGADEEGAQDEQEGAGGDGSDSDDSEASDEETDGPGASDEDEEAEDADPLEELDELDDDVGADEPTDLPVKSEGDPDTDPLGLGDEIEGIAEDAESSARQDNARRQHQQQKPQTQALAEKQLGRREVATPVGRMRYETKLAEERGAITALANRLRAVLQHNAMEASSTGHKRGRFDVGKAYRLKSANVRVFRRPGQLGELDYTFGLLIDTSGSMFSTNFTDSSGAMKKEAQAAFEALVLIAEALERAGLGVFIVLWDDKLRHVKRIREPLEPHRGSIGHAFAGPGGGDTIESPAIAWAIEEMRGVKGRRMLICITDGVTTTIQESRELLDEVEKSGIYGLTIRIGGPPAPHWKHGFAVQHADELTRLLPKLINQVVQRGS